MEPTPMVSLRPLVLHKTIELNSDKLGEVPRMKRSSSSSFGTTTAKRALIKFKGADGAEQQGWVTSVLKDGTENLRRPALATASAPSKHSSSPTTEPPPDLNAASAGAGAGAGASTAKPAAAAAVSSTPHSIPLKATPRHRRDDAPRAAPGGGMTPRAAPGGGMTPRAAPGGGMTPRRGGGGGGKEVLAPCSRHRRRPRSSAARKASSPNPRACERPSLTAHRSAASLSRRLRCRGRSPPRPAKAPPPPEPLPPLPSEASLRFKLRATASARRWCTLPTLHSTRVDPNSGGCPPVQLLQRTLRPGVWRAW